MRNLKAEETQISMKVNAAEMKTCRMSPQIVHVLCIHCRACTRIQSAMWVLYHTRTHKSHWLCSAHGVALPIPVRSCVPSIRLTDFSLKNSRNRIKMIFLLRFFRVTFNKYLALAPSLLKASAIKKLNLGSNQFVQEFYFRVFTLCVCSKVFQPFERLIQVLSSTLFKSVFHKMVVEISSKDSGVQNIAVRL